MSDPDRSSPDVPEVRVTTVEMTPTELMTAPMVPDTATLTHAFRQLQQRIPGFRQLSLPRRRSMARAAYLDPELIEAGLIATYAAEEDAPFLTGGLTGEQCRELAADIAERTELEREITALLKGVSSGLLEQKHRLGEAILRVYRMLGVLIDDRPDRYNRLRPHYEAMKRIYLEKHASRRRKKAADPEAPAE